MTDIGNNPSSAPTVAARRATDAALGLIASAGRSGRVFGTTGTPWVTLASISVAAKAVHPGSTLRLTGLLAKYIVGSANGGCQYRVVFVQGANTVVVSQTSLTATVGVVPLSAEISLSYDRKWGFLKSRTVNMLGQASMSAGTYSEDVVQANVSPSSFSPRAQSQGIAFASYTAPPTVETKLIDFDQAFDALVQIAPVANDSYELLAFDIEQLSHGYQGINFANPKATLCAGDSLTEGTGAGTSGSTDWVSVFAKTRPGRPVLNFGLGGQLITSIADRILADPITGKFWDLILWAGINDVGSDGSTWWATVYAQIERIRAFRAAGTKMMIGNLHNSTSWSAQQLTAAAYVNSQLSATYGSAVVDIATAINGDASNYSDAIHLTDAGYAKVAAAFDAKATALGWA